MNDAERKLWPQGHGFPSPPGMDPDSVTPLPDVVRVTCRPCHRYCVHQTVLLTVTGRYGNEAIVKADDEWRVRTWPKTFPCGRCGRTVRSVEDVVLEPIAG